MKFETQQSKKQKIYLIMTILSGIFVFVGSVTLISGDLPTEQIPFLSVCLLAFALFLWLLIRSKRMSKKVISPNNAQVVKPKEKPMNVSNDSLYEEALYKEACSMMDSSKTAYDFILAADKFNYIPHYKDADVLSKKCFDNANKMRDNFVVQPNSNFVKPPPLFETHTCTSTSFLQIEREKRTLPVESKWKSDRVTEWHKLSEEYEEGDARYAPEEGLPTVSRHGPTTYIKLLSSKRIFEYVQAVWEYKQGYFNPWILRERLRLYMESLGMGLSGIYSDIKYEIGLHGQPQEQYNQNISIKFYSEDETAFDSISEIIEKFLLDGYEPTDKVLFDEVIRKNTPVRMETETRFSGYHDENDFIVRLYNIDNEQIAELVERDYPWFSGIYPMSNALISLGENG